LNNRNHHRIITCIVRGPTGESLILQSIFMPTLDTGDVHNSMRDSESLGFWTLSIVQNSKY
jgi:hypothetical protein